MKIHLVIKNSGSYEDYQEEPLVAFLDIKKANKFANDYHKNAKKLNKTAEHRRKEIEKEITQLSNHVKKTFDEDETETKIKLDKLWDEYTDLQNCLEYNSMTIKEIDLIE